MKKEYITGFIGIFEKKLESQKERIKAELDKPKKERNRHTLKVMLKETKQLQRRLREVKEHSAQRCPHCGEII